MDKNYLDYTGLTKYTEKLEAFVDSKVAGLVPMSRTVNGKALTSDISLSAEDVGVKPSDWSPDLSGLVPTSRTVNGKALTSDISLTAEDVGARSSSWTPDLNGLVPTSRTVNGKTLSSNITLSASDVSARPSSWTPTAADVGAVPTTRTVNGKALNSNITLTAEDIGAQPAGETTGVGQSMAGESVKPTSDTTVTAGEGAEIFNDCRDRTFNTNNVAVSGNVASGEYSHAEGYCTTANGTYAHAEGNSTTASGVASHAEGQSTTAGGINSHAEGMQTEASGKYSHAEGRATTASGNYSHSSGYYSEAISLYSHAEGTYTKAYGAASHAEGSKTTASENYSHSEGQSTTASATGSHAQGIATTASNLGSCSMGKYNRLMTGGATYDALVGDVLVIGNGINDEKDSDLSNALRLAYEGTLYLTKSYKSTGADYAEYFEWLDGNPQNEDRVGRFVTLQGNKIVLAQEGNYILGVVSGQPCIIGNSDEDWLGRWEHDDFNRFVKEYLVHNEVKVTPPSDVTSEEFHSWFVGNNIIERDGHYFKMETQVVDYPTPSWRHKANPNYDPSQPYIERKDRQEWDAVGMVGVLSVLDDGTCLPNSYCKVSSNGVATAAERREVNTDTWRVIGRTTPNIIKIIFSIK